MRVQRLDRAIFGWETEQQLIDAGGTLVVVEEDTSFYRFYSQQSQINAGQYREAIGFRASNPNKGYVIWSVEATISGGNTSFTWNFGVNKDMTYNTTHNTPCGAPPCWRPLTADVEVTNHNNFSNTNQLNSAGTASLWQELGIQQQTSSETFKFEGTIAENVDQATGLNFEGGTGEEYQFWFQSNNAAWVYRPIVKLYEFNI